MSAKPAQKKTAPPAPTADYSGLLGGVSELLEAARRASVRTVNAFMTATYWEIGRRIMNYEKHGRDRATYGDAVVERLAEDLSSRLGRGFSRRNVFLMRAFYLAFPQPAPNRPTLPGGLDPTVQTASALSKIGAADGKIVQTPSAQSLAADKRATVSLELQEAEKRPTPSGISQPVFALADLTRAFPLPWSHYVLLISRSRSPEAFAFYHTEALRGGWSVRQLVG